MLILSRNVGERIVIDNDTYITILSVKGNQVRVGIEAPKQVSVHREEIQEKINLQNPQRFTKVLTLQRAASS